MKRQQEKEEETSKTNEENWLPVPNKKNTSIKFLFLFVGQRRSS
jgi:hypothetical protein